MYMYILYNIEVIQSITAYHLDQVAYRARLHITLRNILLDWVAH